MRNLKRVFSLFLACVLMLGILPTGVFAAEDGISAYADAGDGGGGSSSGVGSSYVMPDTITVSRKPSPLGDARKYTFYNKVSTGTNSSMLNNFHVVVNGQEISAFCGDHAKWLGKACREQMDVFKQSGTTYTSADNKGFLFLDYYYTEFFGSQEVEKELAGSNMSEEEKKAYVREWNAAHPDEPKCWLGDYELAIIEQWCQVLMWMMTLDKDAFNAILDDTPEGQALREKVAHERANVIQWLGYNNEGSTYEASLLLINDMVDAYKAGQYNTYRYYEYLLYEKHCNQNQDHQPIIVAQPYKENIEKGDGWVKILKTDTDGRPLAGAEFQVFVDPNCSIPMPNGKMVTGADGWGYYHITQDSGLLPENGTLTLYATETKAPPKPDGGRYELDGGIYNAVAKDGTTMDTATPFNGGMAIRDRPGTTTSSDDDTLLYKVDAIDGSGIGPATFLFEGTEYDPDVPGPAAPHSGYYSTDSMGFLEPLQWIDPTAEGYIPCGTYRISEYVAPPGYKLSDETQMLTLWLEELPDGTQVQRHSGPLVFKNFKKPGIELLKVSDDGQPLAGAMFDVYRNGQKIGSYTTGANGLITLEDVEDGYYEFIETKAPAGFFMPFIHTTSIDVRAEAVPEGYTYHLSMVNYRDTTIRIQKVRRGSEFGIAGAVMEVMIDGELLGRYTTGPEGIIEITSDVYGEFLNNHGLANKESWTVSVREVVAPEGYLLDDDNWQTAELHQGELLKTFVFSNTKYPEVWVGKIDRESKAPLAGASFKISIDGIDIGGPFVTDESGWVKITYEEYKNFLQDFNDPIPYNGWGVTVTEVNTPEFYNKDKQTDSGDYTKTGTLGPQMSKITFEFEDTHYRDVKVKKKDSSTGWPLKGAKFVLESVKLEETGQNNGGTWRQELETDANGEILFENVPNGTYRMYESQAPQGYTKSDEVKTIVVTSDSQRVIEVEWENSPKSGFRILKVDAVTGEPIAGVRFRIRQLAPLTGVDFEATTDENGVIVREDLTAGTYEVTELDAPEPYRKNIDRNPRTIEIQDMHDAVPVTITNQADGMLYILKIDGVTGEPLAGAYFELTTAGGTFVANVGPTGPNGYASYSPLLPGGSYVVKEVRAPEGHEIDPTPQVFQVPEDASGFVKSLIFDNMPWANLWLRKIDAQTGLGLEGAVFKITRGDGSIVKQNAITDQGGYIKIHGLEAGTYVATETRAPEGYTLDPTPHTIVLRQDETEVVIIDNKKPGGLAIRKVDSATGDPLSGATFQLYDIDDKPLGQPVVTGEDGYARWSDLPAGQYMVEEVAAPEGYVRETNRRKIEVKDFEVTQYTWANTQNATISVYKRDGDTLLPLGGAEFEVRDLNGGVVTKLVTDLNGSATTDRLPLGWYRVVETKAPEGYELNDEEHLVEVKADTPVTVEHVNYSRKVIIVHKRDALTKQPLSGAWFELQTIDGTLVQEQFGTDASGVCVTKAVEPGKYYLVETKAPDGYVLNENKILVEVVEGKSTSITVDNVPETIIQIYKTDASTGEPLNGVEFTIMDKNHNIVEIVYTDITGWAYSQILDPGDYIVQETQTIQGYTIDKTEHRVEVFAGKNVILNIKNLPDTSLKIIKLDAVTDKPLAGARFELRYDTGHGDCTYIGEYITDEYGRITTEPLTPGFYMIKEVDAPPGYAVMEEEVRVCVKAPGDSSEGGSQADGLNEVVIRDQPLATLIIRKQDSSTNAPVAGAVMELQTADGQSLGRKETDANGEAIWTNLVEGYYTAIEVIAPDGYDLSGCPQQRVTVKYGYDNVVIFKDNQYASLVIILQDKHSGDYLDGGQFVVTRLSDMTIVFDSKTDVTGTLVVGNLQPGWYEVVQTFAPDGYTMVDVTIKVEIKAGIQQTIYFKDETAGMVIEKVDSKDATKMLEGARFKVVRVADDYTVGEYVTSTDGKVQVKDLVPGIYQVYEVVAPVGYDIDDPNPKTVIVQGGQAAHVTFMDTARASITINVVDAADKTGVAGNIVEVWRQNGELVRSWTSDKTGMIETEKMEPGYYVLKLVQIVDGYRCERVETTVHLTDATEVTYTFELVADGSLTVYSQDAGHVVIPGMKFTVTQVDGKVVGAFETGTDGKYVISGLDAGWYVVTETAAPDGYDIIETSQSVQVTSKTNVDVTFAHAEQKGANVDVSVVVPSTGAGLSGCVVELYTSAGVLVGKYTTDATGHFVTSGLAAGKYTAKLVSISEGYVALISETVITVTAGGSVNFAFECVAQGSLSVTSVGPDGKQIPGMKFEVRTFAGVKIGEYETDADGNRVINNLATGVYVVTETKAPDGVDATTTEYSVEIKTGATTSVSFTHVSKGGVTISVVDANTQAAINGAVIEVWKQNGNLVNTFTTDATGTVVLVNYESGYYVIKLTKLVDGYQTTTTEFTVEIKSGETANIKFECVSDGVLTVVSKDNADSVVAGMKFTVTDLNGTFVASGVTGTDGTFVVADVQPGWYVVTETLAPEGFNIVTAEQRVEVKSGMSVEIVFAHSKTVGLQIRTTCSQTGAVVPDAVYKITTLEGVEIGVYTSDQAGLAFASLTPGWYVITPVSVGGGYTFVDAAPRNVEVKSDQLMVVDFVVNQQSSLRVKIVDGTTGAGIYNVRLQLKNGATCIKEYYTNDQGVVTLDQVILAGGYTLEMISAPDGYIVDKIPHSIDVLSGETTEIVWKLYKDAGQIQVVVTSADYNKELDKAAGQPLQGAVFEITNADTYQVVGQMISDANGIAASSGIPIGRYTVKMVTAPAYYGLNETWNPEIRIKINNDVVRTEVTCPSVTLGTSISQKTNASARAGSTIRVDVLTANNISDTRLDEYFVHIKVPTDAARITTLSPGTWNHAVWYTIQYKTNARDYQTLAQNLSSQNVYTFDLSTQSLGLQAAEYVTDVRLVFGTVPTGFAVTQKTSYSLYVLAGLQNGYKLINRLEMGGRLNTTIVNTNHVTSTYSNPYGTLTAGIVDASSVTGGGQAAVAAPTGQWTTSTSVWTVNITSSNTTPSSLPKTGY